MKILYGITKSNFGGAQRYVFDLACEAKRRGHDVAVLCGDGGALVEKLKAENIRTITLPRLDRDINLLTEIPIGIEVMKVLQKEKPDVFHINSSKMGGTGAFAVRLMNLFWLLTGSSHRTTAVFTAHGWPFWEPRHVMARLLIYFFSWLTAVFAHRVVVVSDYDKRVARRMPFVAHKTVRIYNGIDFNTEFGHGDVIRKAFPVGARITGTVGELNNNKNQIALIEEARRNPDMYVAIVGEGENRAFLEEKICEYGLTERVKLFGFLPREVVLKGFDTFALPSLKEGLPYVLLEAKLAGLELKANPVGGVGEILNQDIKTFSLEKMFRETFALYL